MINIERKYFIFVAIGAFIFYQLVNFIYFPLDTIFIDESRFVGECIRIFNSGEFWIHDKRAWEMPLTAIVYSYIYSIYETKVSLIILVRIFQSSLLILQGFLIYKIYLKIFNDRLGAFIAFVIVLFYPFFIYYQGLLLSENIFITLLIISFYYIYSWYEEDFKINNFFLLANFFLVLTIYSKGTLSLLPPLLLSGFYFFNKYNIRNSIKILCLSLFLYGIFLSPWWIRNYKIFNQFIPFTTSSGMNFYLGNNSSNLNGGCDWSIDVNQSEARKMFNIKDELESNRAFKEEAISFIKNNPERFVELAWLKLKRFYNFIPNAQVYKQGYYKWVSLFSYGVVFVLSLILIIFNIKYFKKLSAIYILFLYYTILHVVFIASIRYRLPIEPFMIILASALVSKVLIRLNIK